MEINKSVHPDRTVLALAGRLDTNTAPKLQEALTSEVEAAQSIELDFTQLAYLSSAGLRVLLIGQKAAQAKGAAMTLANVSAEVMDVLEMTGFSSILTIH